jgi:hypothetical protein
LVTISDTTVHVFDAHTTVVDPKIPDTIHVFVPTQGKALSKQLAQVCEAAAPARHTQPFWA